FFFFQAEDGIRDYKVTGVQTCALPISSRYRSEIFSGIVPGFVLTNGATHSRSTAESIRCASDLRCAESSRGFSLALPRREALPRSEERRVGKECRSRGLQDQ